MFGKIGVAKKSKADTRKNTKAEDGVAPTQAQSKWLQRGMTQAGGKLPLFDENGKRVSERTVKSCVDKGWAEPWFENPVKPDWQICKLTEMGRNLFGN